MSGGPFRNFDQINGGAARLDGRQGIRQSISQRAAMALHGKARDRHEDNLHADYFLRRKQGGNPVLDCPFFGQSAAALAIHSGANMARR